MLQFVGHLTFQSYNFALTVLKHKDQGQLGCGKQTSQSNSRAFTKKYSIKIKKNAGVTSNIHI